MLQRTLLLALSALCLACGPDSETADWQEHDLSTYGLPLRVLAPDSVEIRATEMSTVVRDIILTDGAGYELQIFTSPALTDQAVEVRNNQQQLIAENPYFQRFLEVEDNRFLYELNIDGKVSFGFRQIYLIDQLEVIVQNGLGSLLNLDEAKQMIQNVQLN